MFYIDLEASKVARDLSLTGATPGWCTVCDLRDDCSMEHILQRGWRDAVTLQNVQSVQKTGNDDSRWSTHRCSQKHGS